MDSIDSIDGMDSIDSIESSLIPGRGRGSTSPFSILLMTCRILLSAAPARASISRLVSLSALRISLSILRWASFCRRSCSRTLMLPPLRLRVARRREDPTLVHRGILRPRCGLSRFLDGLFRNLRYIARFSGLRRFGWDRRLARLPAQPVRCSIPGDGGPTVLEACTRFHPHVFTRQLPEACQIHAQDLGDAG